MIITFITAIIINNEEAEESVSTLKLFRYAAINYNIKQKWIVSCSNAVSVMKFFAK